MGKTKKWTIEEDNILRELYPLSSKEEIMQRIQRTWIAIRTRASKIGVIRIQSENNNRKRIHNALVEKILFLAKTKSALDIAKEMSIRKGYVYEIL